MAGLATLPAVFASGLEPGQGPGMLFITLQTVFSSMGGLGPLFGFLFYALVFIAAITSSISLLEMCIRDSSNSEMGKLTGGLGIPGL